MTRTDNDYARRHGLMRVPRSRGAVSGILLIALGIWGAAIPFFGPYFDYAYTPATALTWTSGRLWLEILPGLATIVGGFLLLTTANRAVAVFGGYLASVAGAWFIVGPILGRLWAGPQGATGIPVGGTGRQVVEQLGFFYALGAVILFLAAQALGRFTVRSVRDYQAVERHREEATAREQETVEPNVVDHRVQPWQEPVVSPTTDARTVTDVHEVPVDEHRVEKPLTGSAAQQAHRGGATRM